MIRPRVPLLLALGAVLAAHSVAAQPAPRVLVLPLRSIGVNDTTLTVSRDLLIGSLEDLGVQLASLPADGAPLPSGSEACDAAVCASALGREHGASEVVYGSVSRLGNKLIARLNVIRVDESVPYYRDQLTATTEEDLDTVMRRFAEGIASGRPNSDRATVESVTQAETQTPALRASRSGIGFRAGFLFPAGGSFGGADRLTNLHSRWKYELRDFQIETSTVLGFTWGEGNFDWTILDLGVSRIFGKSDVSPYLGASIGVHSVTVERRNAEMVSSPYTGPYYISKRETKTAPTLDLVAGLLTLRTYDFEAVFEIRYHYVFEAFDEVDGKGANGFLVSIGTSR